MRTVILCTTFILLLTESLISQAGTWNTIADSPTSFKHDDIHFFDRMNGIAVGFEYIYITNDGGVTWIQKREDQSQRFRAAVMLDESTALVGSLNSNQVLRTTDDGATWDTVTINGPGEGVCGLFAIDDDTVYGVGRYTGSARFFKSNDKGATWQLTNLNAYLTGAIDLHFWDENNGIVLGRTSFSSSIIRTWDGGATWSTVYDSGREDEWGWKLSFPTDSVGYASIQRSVNMSTRREYFARTTDMGATWIEREFWATADNSNAPPYSAQGIGFVNEQVGWIGSYNGYPTMVTENGGRSWREAGWGEHVNRFRFYGDSLAFASGERIYKSEQPIVVGREMELPKLENISVYPNPSTDFFRIDYKSVERTLILIDIYDMTGRKVRSLDEENNGKQLVIPSRGLSPGNYLVKITDGNSIKSFVITKL